ncbi:hypothetical protein niasHT_030394 [Heterodera trifolii]|uniref:Uncharacterized protein n=1 Tax=Heterodera trifolii TaxID=157864 RepID=A0ABD2KTS7_9BILA
MHVDFDPLAVDWSHFAEPPPRMDTMLMSGGGSSMGGGGGGGAAPSYPVFTGLPYQRGAGGIGSMFHSFLRFLVPIGRQAGAAIGRQGLETGSRVLSQMLEERNVKEAMTEEGRAGLKNLLDKAADNLSRQRSAAAAAATNHGGAGRSGRGGGGGLCDFKRYRKIVSNNNNNNHKRKSSSSSTNNIKRNKKRRTSILQSTVGPSLSTPAAAIAAKTKGQKKTKVKNELSKKISEQSALAFNSALNVFAVPPTNVSVSRSFFRELLPLSTISQEGPYLFRMFNDNLWADMSRVYLFLELSIQKEDAGGRWVEVQNTELYDSGTLYPYKAYLTNELSFPNSAKGHFMASAGYHPSLKHDNATDAGFLARCARFEGGRKARFLSRLDFDLGNQELYLLNNMDVLFTIYRAKNTFLLQNLAAAPAAGAAARQQYALYLHDIKLCMKVVEVQPSLNLSIYKTLEKQPATYAMDHNIFSAAIPRRLTIALVANGAFNGQLAQSPFNFKPYSIREISVHAGRQIYPAVPHRMDFSGSAYIRPFVDMYEALGMANSERSMDITLDQFRDGWTIFVVPMTSTLDDSCGFELLRSGTTSIRLAFNEEIPAGGVEMVVLGEFDHWMILYEPRAGGRMVPHPLFDPGPEMSARVIATAPLFSTSYFSTQRANESDDSVAGAVISSGGSNVAYTVTEAALLNNTTSSTLMGTTSAAAVTTKTAMTAAGARVDGAVQIWSTLFLFANYAIVLPMFLLCWMMVVHWLRRFGLMPPPHQSPSTPQHPHRYGGLHTIFEDTVDQKSGQEKDVQQQHQQKEQQRSHTSSAAIVTTEAMVREAHRVTSQLAAAIPEPMRSAVTSSVAIPMLVSAAQSGGGRKEATQHNSEEEKERN